MRKILFFAVPFVFMAACADSKTAVTDELPIAIHSSIRTRASDTAFENGDKIGVTITLDGNSVYKENAELVHNGEYFEAPDLRWYSVNNKGHFDAYYPFEQNFTGNFNISVDQTAGGYTDSDLMLAVADNVQPHVQGVALTFLHVMSQLVVRINNNSSFTVTGVTVGKTKTGVSIDFESMSVSLRMAAKYEDIAGQPLSDDMYRVVIAPQDATAEITVHLDGVPDVETTLPAHRFDPGKSYRVTLSVNDDFDITDVEILSDGDITSWEDGGNIQ